MLRNIRTSVYRTLASCKLECAADLARTAYHSVYILDYWLDFDGRFPGAVPKMANIRTRFYSPVGNGASIDLIWHSRLVEGELLGGESHASLQVKWRSLADICPSDPTAGFSPNCSERCSDLPGSGSGVLCLAAVHGRLPASVAEGDATGAAAVGEDGLQKSFAPHGTLQELGSSFFSMDARSIHAMTAASVPGRDEHPQAISARKLLALLARAAGVKVAAAEDGNWLYPKMRELFELATGEESDDQDDIVMSSELPWV